MLYLNRVHTVRGWKTKHVYTSKVVCEDWSSSWAIALNSKFRMVRSQSCISQFKKKGSMFCFNFGLWFDSYPKNSSGSGIFPGGWTYVKGDQTHTSNFWSLMRLCKHMNYSKRSISATIPVAIFAFLLQQCFFKIELTHKTTGLLFTALKQCHLVTNPFVTSF